MTREREIIHQNGFYWVHEGRNCYGVFRDTSTHAVSDSVYAKTPDGLLVAVARCNYLARRANLAA